MQALGSTGQTCLLPGSIFASFGSSPEPWTWPWAHMGFGLRQYFAICFFFYLTGRQIRGHLLPPSYMPHRTGQLTLAPLRTKVSQGLRPPGRGKSWNPPADHVGPHSRSATAPSASGQFPDLSGHGLYPCKKFMGLWPEPHWSQCCPLTACSMSS